MATPNIVPRADSEGGLGTASKYWASAYIDLIYVGAGKVGRDADNLIDFSTDNVIALRVNATDEVRLSQYGFAPFSSDGLPLGAASNQWSDLYLASGATINFDNGNVTLTHSSGALTLADGQKFNFGSGNDLQIKHTGSGGFITNVLGDLTISTSSNGGDIKFLSDNGSGGTTPYITLDGGEGHTIVHKEMQFQNNIMARFGDSNAGQIYHSGSVFQIDNLIGNMAINNFTDDGDIIFSTDDGSGGTTAYLTLDGGEGHMIAYKELNFADGVSATFGNTASGDLEIKEQSGDSYILNNTGDLLIQNHANDKDVKFQCDNGDSNLATYFYLDGSSATYDSGATTALYTNWPDKSYISLGTSHDLRIYHDGTNSHIANHIGEFRIESWNDDLKIINYANDKDVIFISDDGNNGTATYFRLDGNAATYGSGATTALYTNWPDKSRISLGTSHDLQIFHNAANSFIENTGGNLYLVNYADGGDIVLSSDDGGTGTTAYLTIDGGAGFTYSHKKIRFTGDNAAAFGDSDDLQIYHDGNTSIRNDTGNLTILNRADDGDVIFQASTGSATPATYLTLDGSATNIKVAKDMRFNDNVEAEFGTNGDFKIYHDGSNTYLEQINAGTGNIVISNANDDGDILFKSDNGAGGIATYFKIDGATSTHDGSAITALYTNWPDKSRISMGDSHDLRIYHDGSNSYISDTGTGSLILQSSDLFLRTNSTENSVVCANNAGVTLYYDNAAKLSTTSTGVDVTGILGVGATSPGTINSVAFSSVGLHTNSGTLGRTITEGSNSAEFIANDSGASANERAKFFGSDSGVLSIGKYADNGTATAQLSISNGGDATFVGSVTPALGVTKPIASAAANVAAAVAGSIYTFSDADGAIVTLPDSGGGGLVGQTFEFVCTATATSNSHKVIFSDTTNEKFIGRLTAIDTDTDNTQLVYVPATANKAIVMNGTTTGITGSRFTITNVAADIWMIEGYVHHTGNTANPFANS